MCQGCGWDSLLQLLVLYPKGQQLLCSGAIAEDLRTPALPVRSTTSLCCLPSAPFPLGTPPAGVFVLLPLWRALLCPLWPGSPSRQDRDLGQTLTCAMGHHLNAGVEDPPFLRILLIPLQFPSWSPDFQLLPLFPGSKSPLCCLKKYILCSPSSRSILSADSRLLLLL